MVEENKERTEQELAEELTKLVEANHKVALLDGHFYTLILSPLDKADALTKRILQVASNRIVKIKEVARQEVAQAKYEASLKVEMPLVSLEDLKKGVWVYRDEDRIGFVLPFHYAPKFIGLPEDVRKGQDVIELCEEHKKRLKQDILLRVDTGGRAEIIHPKTYQYFRNYNGTCLGQGGAPHVENLQDAIEYRNKMELVYGGIHALHEGRREEPEDFPTWAELKEKGIRTKVVNGWGGEKAIQEKEDKEEKVEGQIQVGSMVKVLAEHDGVPLEGVIGKVVTQPAHEGVWGVEFLGEDVRFHNLDGACPDRHGFWIPVEKLQLVPAGTRRTHMKEKEGREVKKEEQKKGGWTLDGLGNVMIIKRVK